MEITLLLIGLALVALAAWVNHTWATFGVVTEDEIGVSLSITADGLPEAKAGGVTIDWSTVTAVSVDTTWKDGFLVKSGEKALRYGQVICMMGVAEVQTYTLTGGPTAGTATITFPATDFFDAESFTIAFDATGAAVQAALQALVRTGPNGVTVARTGAGSAGDPYIFTATFNRNLGNVSTPTGTHTYTGGTTPTITIATSTPGTGGGKYGPYDSAATDGRATLGRGVSFILNSSVRENDIKGDHPQAIYGGMVYRKRLIATVGTHSLAAGPTFTEIESTFPRLTYADLEN